MPARIKTQRRKHNCGLAGARIGEGGYSKPFSTGAVVVAEDAIVIQDVVKSKGAYVERTFVQCWRRKG